MAWKDKPSSEKVAWIRFASCIISAILGPILVYEWKKKGNENKSRAEIGVARQSSEPQRELLTSTLFEHPNITGAKAPTQAQYLKKGFITAGAINVIFGSDGQGKSGVFHQLMHDIVAGVKTNLLPDDVDLQTGQRGIIYESELSPEDYEQRGYKSMEVVFGSKFMSVDDFFWDFETRLAQVHEDVIIGIDDITYAFPQLDPETSRKIVLRLKDNIDRKKKEGYTLTILYVLHTDKQQELHKSLQLDSVSGCANLLRAADNVIAVGPTRMGDDHKLIKNIKPRGCQRSGEVYVVRQCYILPRFHFEYEQSAKEEYVLPFPIKPVKVQGHSIPQSEPKSSGLKEDVRMHIAEIMARYPKPTDKVVAKELKVSDRTWATWKKELGYSAARTKRA